MSRRTVAFFLIPTDNIFSKTFFATVLSRQNVISVFRDRYEALYAYAPTKADELELIKGEKYAVFETCQDYWFRGTHIKSGRTGVFPWNYVIARYGSGHLVESIY